MLHLLGQMASSWGPSVQPELRFPKHTMFFVVYIFIVLFLWFVPTFANTNIFVEEISLSENHLTGRFPICWKLKSLWMAKLRLNGSNLVLTKLQEDRWDFFPSKTFVKHCPGQSWHNHQRNSRMKPAAFVSWLLIEHGRVCLPRN